MSISYLQLAKSASLLSTHPKYKMGAVIVNKKPVSVGCNLIKTHPRFASGENGTTLSIHAEIRAILSCPRRQLTGAEIWVYRENRYGDTALAKPCQKCLAVIEEVGIKRVYFTTENGYERIDL
jgi:deoxycytidylate deaminase